MGLPLFIAPVESDLVCKAPAKRSATTQSRSSIRRQSQPDSRERRSAARRHVSIRERIANGTLRVSTTSSPREDSTPPWLADGFPPEPLPTSGNRSSSVLGPDGLRRPRPFRDVLREMTQSDDRRRDQLEAQLHALFASTDNRDTTSNRTSTLRTSDDSNPDISNSWWSVDGPNQAVRSRFIGSWNSRYNRDEDDQLFWPGDAATSNPVDPSTTNQHSIITQTTADMSNLSRRSRPERETVFPFARRAIRRGRDRGASSQRSRGVDGLGDRDRSLSPEVWDTLLTTLTPDPQPPSAGSSFASTVASQSAGTSSRTSFTAPDPPVANAADQACESAWEQSDTEELDYEHPDFARIRRRREEVRRARMAQMRVPDHSTYGSVDRPVDGPPSRRAGGVEPDRSALRRRRSPDGPLLATREPNDAGADGSHEADGPLNPPLQRPRHGWVGQLSVGASDDEQNTERQRLNRESSTTSVTNGQLGGEEWQRIVRSLARREDIPDEWWAEAGLSRILPRDPAE